MKNHFDTNAMPKCDVKSIEQQKLDNQVVVFKNNRVSSCQYSLGPKAIMVDRTHKNRPISGIIMSIAGGQILVQDEQTTIMSVNTNTTRSYV